MTTMHHHQLYHVSNPYFLIISHLFFRLLVIAPVPSTVLEALQQRHDEFAKRQQDAVSKGESSKARRMERLKNVYNFCF